MRVDSHNQAAGLQRVYIIEDMDRWRIFVTGAAMLALAGCAAETPQCTAIGSPAGLSLEIAAPLATTATQVDMQVCWDGECYSPAIELLPSLTSEPQDCTGPEPDDSCSAKQVPAGGKHGFAEMPELPAAEVEVAVTLHDSAGTQVFHDMTIVMPEPTYPNGPQCAADGVQAALIAERTQLRQAS